MAITEALGSALPVVISPACHFPEVQEVGAGSIVELDPAAIGRALVALLKDPDRRASAGAAGRRLVLSRFTWPTIAQACIDAYGRRSAPAPSPELAPR